MKITNLLKQMKQIHPFSISDAGMKNPIDSLGCHVLFMGICPRLHFPRLARVTAVNRAVHWGHATDAEDTACGLCAGGSDKAA